MSIAWLLVSLTVAAPGSVMAAEFSTLFTTPQERQIIDSNRYKTEDRKPKPAPVEVEPVIEDIRPVLREEVTQEYVISGITISTDGMHTVWINAQHYEDGEQLEDSSRIKIIVGDEIRVRITAPDGQNHYATSGETLEVTYLAPVGN